MSFPVMYVLGSNPHEHIQYTLRRWLYKRHKLLLNIYAGKCDDVIIVNEADGVVFDLIHFFPEFLKKYYNKENFKESAELLVFQLAGLIKSLMSDISVNDIDIAITVCLKSEKV